MSERQLDIADMQCWVFRMAQSKWKMSSSNCTELFRKYDILGFIAECYDILHLNGYSCCASRCGDLVKESRCNLMIELQDGILLYHGQLHWHSQRLT